MWTVFQNGHLLIKIGPAHNRGPDNLAHFHMTTWAENKQISLCLGKKSTISRKLKCAVFKDGNKINNFFEKKR